MAFNVDDYEEGGVRIDVSRLRKDLLDDCYGAYFGGGFGAALVESFDIEEMSDQEVVDYAAQNGIDLRRYRR